MFKEYIQNQIQLLPPDLEGEIAEDHLVRIINLGVEAIDISNIESKYSEQGQNAYNPRMLLKVIIYGYAVGIRSSRKLANACQENIVFMWLSGRQTPDFRTISDFRKEKLTDVKKIFLEVLGICQNLGMIYCGKVSLDGTKALADSNRHKIQYRKTIEQRNQILEEQIETIFNEAESLDGEEDKLYGELDQLHTGKKVDAQEIQKQLKKIESRKKTVKKQLDTKKEKQEENNSKLQTMEEDRNSYAKADPEATAMRMKEDYTAPGYNVQLATERQVIISYGVFRDRNDHYTLEPMMKDIKDNMGKCPATLITDCGYGNKKNYQYLDKNKQQYVIPYQSWRKDKGKRNKGTYTTTNKDPDWEQKKWQIWNHLRKEENKKLMKRRGIDVEATIGDIKHNMNFRRFLLRGKQKVEIETGIVSIAHNFKKIKSSIEYWNDYLTKIILQTVLATA